MIARGAEPQALAAQPHIMRALRRATTERPPPRPLCLSQQDSLYLPRVRLAGKQKSQNSGEMAALVRQIRGGPPPVFRRLAVKAAGIVSVPTVISGRQKSGFFQAELGFLSQGLRQCRSRDCFRLRANHMPGSAVNLRLLSALFLPQSCRGVARLRSIPRFLRDHRPGMHSCPDSVANHLRQAGSGQATAVARQS